MTINIEKIIQKLTTIFLSKKDNITLYNIFGEFMLKKEG